MTHRNKYKDWLMRKGEDWIIKVVSMECDDSGMCYEQCFFNTGNDNGRDGHQPGEESLDKTATSGWVLVKCYKQWVWMKVMEQRWIPYGK